MTTLEFCEVAEYSKQRNYKLDLVKLVTKTTNIGLRESKEFVEEIFGYSNISESKNTGRIFYNRLIKKYPTAKEHIERFEITEEYVKIVKSFKSLEKKIENNMTYEEKLKIANDHLENIGVPVEWDDLSDINSLHDCDTEEEIKAAAEERAAEDGFDISGFEEDDDSENEEDYEG